ncbi:hypothetical protein H6B10_17205, partial [Gemmiger formicilis]|nr:hypothetical protein [Gemmiger formicilis]
KQHSVIDVVFGILLALALDYAATVFQHEASPLGRQQRPDASSGGAGRQSSCSDSTPASRLPS